MRFPRTFRSCPSRSVHLCVLFGSDLFREYRQKYKMGCQLCTIRAAWLFLCWPHHHWHRFRLSSEKVESVELIRWGLRAGYDCTAIGDEVVIMIMMMLSMVMMCISLSFYAWLVVVRCMHGGWVGLGMGRWNGPTDNSTKPHKLKHKTPQTNEDWQYSDLVESRIDNQRENLMKSAYTRYEQCVDSLREPSPLKAKPDRPTSVWCCLLRDFISLFLFFLS